MTLAGGARVFHVLRPTQSQCGTFLTLLLNSVLSLFSGFFLSTVFTYL